MSWGSHPASSMDKNLNNELYITMFSNETTDPCNRYLIHI